MIIKEYNLVMYSKKYLEFFYHFVNLTLHQRISHSGKIVLLVMLNGSVPGDPLEGEDSPKHPKGFKPFCRLSQWDICWASGLRQETVSRVQKRLRSYSVIEPVSHPDDGRKTAYVLNIRGFANMPGGGLAKDEQVDA